jgi:hypothetical protein
MNRNKNQTVVIVNCKVKLTVCFRWPYLTGSCWSEGISGLNFVGQILARHSLHTFIDIWSLLFGHNYLVIVFSGLTVLSKMEYDLLPK